LILGCDFILKDLKLICSFFSQIKNVGAEIFSLHPNIYYRANKNKHGRSSSAVFFIVRKTFDHRAGAFGNKNIIIGKGQ
jgi:hypothetical protein